MNSTGDTMSYNLDDWNYEEGHGWFALNGFGAVCLEREPLLARFSPLNLFDRVRVGKGVTSFGAMPELGHDNLLHFTNKRGKEILLIAERAGGGDYRIRWTEYTHNAD